MASCLYCGSDVSENALYCRKCMVPIPQPPRRRRPGTLSLLLGVSLLFGSPCAWVIAGQVRSKIGKEVHAQGTVHAASLHKKRAVNQAVALIRQCGQPNRDVSTAYNNPRPPIPFRVLSYKSQHLEFAFVPGGGAKIGDPPPYVWKLSGILDTTTNQRITAAQAVEQMACVAPALAPGSTPGPASVADSQPPAGAPTAGVPNP